MTTVSLSRFFLLVLLWVAFLIGTTSALPPTPAWIVHNQVSPNEFTTAAGAPYVGLSITNTTSAFIINGVNNLITGFTGNTTVCFFHNATSNSTSCDQNIVSLIGTSWTIPSISLSNADDGSYFIDAVYQGDQIAETSTFCWNAAYGVEWFKFRGAVAKNSYIPFPRTNTFVMSVAVDGGAVENIVGAATFDHKLTVAWTTPVTIPAADVKNYTSYATDFVTIARHDADTTMVAFTSLGRVFVIEPLRGFLFNELTSPCGYNSTDFRMLKATHVLVYGIGYTNLLIVYGNVPNKGFVVCGLAANTSLNVLLSIEEGVNITLADGDKSVKVISSAPQGDFPLPHIDVTTTNLYVSGSIDGDAKKTYLWSFSIGGVTYASNGLSWRFHRPFGDRFNMPVAMNDGYYGIDIVITLNSVITAINPLSGYTRWSWNCNRGCSSTPAVLRDSASGEGSDISRLFCVSSNDSSSMTLIALSINATEPQQQAANVCSVAWETTVPSPIDIQAQPMADLIVNYEYPLEPFVVFVDVEGTTWSVSARSEFEIPHYAPPPPPTPAPLTTTNVPAPNVTNASSITTTTVPTTVPAPNVTNASSTTMTTTVPTTEIPHHISTNPPATTNHHGGKSTTTITTTPAPTSNHSNNHHNNGGDNTNNEMSKGELLGLAAGGAFAGVILGLLVFYSIKRYCCGRNTDDNQNETSSYRQFHQVNGSEANSEII